MASTYQIIENFGKTVVDKLGKSLPENKDATGDLRESIRFNIKILGNKFVFQLSLKDYYINVNDGRKKGKLPPFMPIRTWVLNKRLKIRTNMFSKRGNRVLKAAQKHDRETVDNIAKSIQWSIKKKGIKPTHFYDNVVNEKLLTQLKKDITDSVKKDILITIVE